MKKAISKSAFINNNSSLAFDLNQEAVRRERNGEKVFNVCLGSLFNDDNKLISFKDLDDIVIKNVNDGSKKYAQIDGGEPFKSNIQKQILDEYFNDISSNYILKSCATPGGTGALFLAFKNYTEENPILIPDIGWGNYKSICSNLNLKYETYRLFNGESFNVNGLLEQAKISVKSYGFCTILINDPCENPTGYSLTDDEWSLLVSELNKLSKQGTVNLILDVAYMEYGEEPRKFFKHISKNKAEFLILVCFSASKLFGIYGYRLGAIMCISNNESDALDFDNACNATSRSTWSNINHLAINAFNEYFANETMRKDIRVYTKEGRELLKKRYLEVRNMFDKIIGDEPLPYKEGFFIVYEKENANEFCRKLVEKNIFALPLDNKYIRISLCSFVNK